MKKRISYSEALKAKNNSGYSFVKFLGLGDDLKKYTSYTNVESRLKIMNKNIKHQKKFHQKFILQCAKMVNFMFRKGYRLHLEGKNLFQNMGHLLRILHLKEIYFYNCLITLEFALPFSKGIEFNRTRLHSFNLLACTDLYGGSLDEKSSRLILNSLSFCSNLGDIGLDNHCYFPKGKHSIPESYIFVSRWFHLKTISLYQFSFHDDMNFHYFKSLTSLQELCLDSCIFQANSFLLLYGNNIPKLDKLILRFNSMIDFNSKRCDDIIPNLDDQMKFPPIVKISGRGKYCLEYYIFSKLIQSLTSTLKSLFLSGNDSDFSQEQFKGLIKIFELSKLESLELNGSGASEAVLYPEFSDFLKNSLHLKNFKLQLYPNKGYNLFFKTMKYNQSIQILFLGAKRLSEDSTGLLKDMIMFNSSISTLVLNFDDEIDIDGKFIEAVLKSKSLKYLLLHHVHTNLYKSEYENLLSWCNVDVVSTLPSQDELSRLADKANPFLKDGTLLDFLKTNLKGIYITKSAISKEAMNEIHRKIPIIEYSENLQYYEKFLK